MLNDIETEADEKQVQKTIREMEKEGRETEISLKWHAYDVLSMDKNLTPEQVEDVLSLMKSKHDATIGVSWDTIQVWIDHVKDGA